LTQRLRVGVIGCGLIAQVMHLHYLRELSDLYEIAAVCDLSPELLEAVAHEYGEPAQYAAWQELVAHPLDAVFVLTSGSHAPAAIAAARAGRHVLVEKPIARTLAEADQMIETARARGRVLMVAENFHYMPAFRRVRALVAAGRLGDLRDLLLVSRGFRERTGWRLEPEAAGGGCLLDGGIHYVHNLRSWGGDVRRVFGLTPPGTLDARSGEDAVSALLELDRGVVGFLANSLATRGVPALQWSSVSGTRGTCFADNRGRFVVVRGVDGSSARAYWRDRRGHEAMLRAFLGAITTGVPPETDGREGRRDLAVVLAVYRSVRERLPVDVEC